MSNCSECGFKNLAFGQNSSKFLEKENIELQLAHDSNRSVTIQHASWIVFGLLICACNWLTIAILTRIPRHSANQTTMHLLLGNLALADSLVGVTLLLLTGIEMQNNAYRHTCLAIYGLFMLSAGASTTTLTLLAHDRYKAIVHPLGHRLRKGDNEQTIRNLAITWSLWCILGLIPVLPVIALTDNPLSHQCRLVVDIQKWHVFTTMVILQGISYLFIAFYHIQIVRTNRSKNRIFPQISTSTMTPYVATRMRQHVVLTRKVIVITGLFLICWIPFQVMITIFSACPQAFQSNGDIHCGISGNRFTVPATMATMNSLVNSIVYIFVFKKFRKALKEMVWCSRKKQSLVTTDSSVATITEPSRVKPQKLQNLTHFSQIDPPNATGSIKKEN